MRVGFPGLVFLLASCGSSGDPAPEGAWACEELPAAVVDVTGTYDYTGSPGYFLRGTITFQQTGTTVVCTGTTYVNSNDRQLEGTATIVGNRLDITLVPINGDLDYEADVSFLFSPDGNQFCCGFSDTNFDTGPLGSYTGVRR
ncbi:MAG TPA: hypothetical protein VFY93_00840 [Planctomycetota bacterium]|nr:hypothetical protein [Planctomycetota bacterium]